MSCSHFITSKKAPPRIILRVITRKKTPLRIFRLRWLTWQPLIFITGVYPPSPHPKSPICQRTMTGLESRPNVTSWLVFDTRHIRHWHCSNKRHIQGMKLMFNECTSQEGSCGGGAVSFSIHRVWFCNWQEEQSSNKRTWWHHSQEGVAAKEPLAKSAHWQSLCIFLNPHRCKCWLAWFNINGQPALCDSVLSGHPVLSGRLSKSRICFPVITVISSKIWFIFSSRNQR